MKFLKTCLTVSLIALSSATLKVHAQNFPYNATYSFGGGSVSATQTAHNNTILSHWSDWKTNFVTSVGAGSGKRRVLFDGTPGQVQGNPATYWSVSEGQGYGMLLAVYFGDQGLFDDVFAYFKSKLSSNGLMGWKIDGAGTVLDTNNASDADEDVAAALCLAAKRWGGSSRFSYASEANVLINNLKLYDFWPDGWVKEGNWDGQPGDAVHVGNTSFFMPAWYRLYKENTGDSFWDTAISKGYSIMSQVAHPVTGLFPVGLSYTASTGIANTPAPTEVYQDDAVRIPWRVGLDWLWNGDSRAKALMSKLGGFYAGVINTSSIETPGVYYVRQIDGTVKNMSESGAFTGMAGVAVQVQPNTAKSQFLLRSILESNLFKDDCKNSYYSGALNLFSSLVMTGNFPSVFPITVYGDSLASDWLDWSWGGARTFNNASPVKVGASSVKVNFTSAYGGFSLRKGTVIKAAGYTSLKFWAYGAGGAHPLLAYLETADTGGETVKVSVSAPANGWTEFTINLSAFGSPSQIKRISFQSPGTGVVYFDDIRLVP